ncbi:MAG: DUF393 domain-containing protein [Chitinophagaceae bacterium]|nr:DUF393 domain-containing protein [Chitinophagaceae bacterium]
MNNKVIIYDDSCPLCAAYTSAFVKTGLIDEAGRRGFSNVSPELLAKIDIKKSVNEIPLIDTATNQVWYGIDALLEILQQKIPFIKAIVNIKPVKWVLQKLYKFISYNRRVIVAAKKTKGHFDGAPDFNLRYRLAFLVIFLAFNTMMLFPLHQYVLQGSIFNRSIGELQFAHLLLVFINIIIAFRLNKKDGFSYLGQVNMLALTTILLCVPLILINRYAGLSNASFNSFYLGLIAFFSVHEYIRRFRYIGFYKEQAAIILLNAVCVSVFFIYLAV